MKSIFIDKQEDIIRIATRENGELEDIKFEEDREVKVGDIYLGRVQNVVNAINSAFIDIGLLKNAFLNLRQGSELKQGDMILVEILAEPILDKGARVSEKINILGETLVLSNKGPDVSVSSKIKNKYKFYNIITEAKPKITYRTKAETSTRSEIKGEFETLNSVYESLINNASFGSKIGLVYSNGDILEKFLKSIDIKTVEKFIVNNEDLHRKLKEKFSENKGLIIELYKDDIPIFTNYKLDDEILKLMNKDITLEGGGFITIENTEAMTVCDVNSGENNSNKNKEHTAYKVNLDAAATIARQIILRNISGIIAIDFINMNIDSNNENVLLKLKEGLSRSKVKFEVFPINELGVAYISRRRIGNNIRKFICENIEKSSYRLERLKFSYLRYLIRCELVRLKDFNNILIEIDDIYKKDIEANKEDFIEKLGIKNKVINISYKDLDSIFKCMPISE